MSRPGAAASPRRCSYTLDNLDKLVVKLVDGSGGYGMLVGPTATKKEIEDFRAALKAEPHRYIAQPTLALSTVPTFTDAGHRAAPCRFPPVRPDRRRRGHDRPRRPHPGRAARRLAGGQFEPGRRHQGQLRSSPPTPTGEEQLMLSRTAANLYWIGRYMERAEFTTRLIEATIRLERARRPCRRRARPGGARSRWSAPTPAFARDRRELQRRSTSAAI